MLPNYLQPGFVSVLLFLCGCADDHAIKQRLAKSIDTFTPTAASEEKENRQEGQIGIPTLAILKKSTPETLKTPVISAARIHIDDRGIELYVYWVGLSPRCDQIEFTSAGQDFVIAVPISSDIQRQNELESTVAVHYIAFHKWHLESLSVLDKVAIDGITGHAAEIEVVLSYKGQHLAKSKGISVTRIK